MEDITVEKFIGKARYDKPGQMIFGQTEDGDQLIVDVRGWGAIQYLFKNKNGTYDLNKAEKFQDELGQFITDAINEKLNNT